MSRIFLACSFAAFLLLLPAAAGGQTGAANHGAAGKVKLHAGPSVRVHLAQVPARQQQPVSHPRMANPQLLSQTTSPPASAPATAEDPDIADLDGEDVDDDQSDTANVDDEEVEDDHADTADVENGDTEDDHEDTADVEEGDQSDEHSDSEDVDDGEAGDD